jgi:hypothetical protein
VDTNICRETSREGTEQAIHKVKFLTLIERCPVRISEATETILSDVLCALHQIVSYITP